MHYSKQATLCPHKFVLLLSTKYFEEINIVMTNIRKTINSFIYHVYKVSKLLDELTSFT